MWNCISYPPYLRVIYTPASFTKTTRDEKKPEELTLDQQVNQKNVLIYNNYTCHKKPHIKHTISKISVFIYFKGKGEQYIIEKGCRFSGEKITMLIDIIIKVIKCYRE